MVLVVSPGIDTTSRPMSAPPSVMRDTVVTATGATCGRSWICSGVRPGIWSTGSSAKL